MPTRAQISRTPPELAGPNFALVTSDRRGSRLPMLVAILASLIVLLAGRHAPTGMAGGGAATSAIIAGRVLDEQGEPLAGATVTFADGRASSAVQSDTAGRFVSRPLRPGIYDVGAELFGFQRARPLTVSVPFERPAELTMALAPIPGR